MYSTPYYNRVRAQRAGSARPLTSLQAQPKDPSNSFLNNLDYSQIAGGIGQGFSSYGQAAADTYDFSIDPFAGYKGSFQGLSQGGVLGAITGGIGAQIGTFSEVNKNLKALDTSVNLTGYSSTGQPIYSGEGYLNANQKIDALNDGLKAANKAYDPATVAFNGIFGTSRRIRNKRQEVQRNRTAAQGDYNKSAERFENQQTSLDDYYNRLSLDDQLANLYRV